MIIQLKNTLYLQSTLASLTERKIQVEEVIC